MGKNAPLGFDTKSTILKCVLSYTICLTARNSQAFYIETQS